MFSVAQENFIRVTESKYGIGVKLLSTRLASAQIEAMFNPKLLNISFKFWYVYATSSFCKFYVHKCFDTSFTPVCNWFDTNNKPKFVKITVINNQVYLLSSSKIDNESPCVHQ